MSNPIVERFRDGQVPEHVKAAAARGALPLPAEDLLQVLFHLRGEKALQGDIVTTISDMPVEALLQVADSPGTPPEMLGFLARASFKRSEVIEKLLLNPHITDETLALIARHGTAHVLELLMLNQARLTQNPQIIQAILDNGNTTLTIRRRLKEIWDLHQASALRRKEREQRQAVEKAEAEKEAAEKAAEEEATRRAEDEEAAEAAQQAAEAGDEGSSVSMEDLLALAESVGGLDGLKDLEALGDSQLDAAVLEELQNEGASKEELRLAERLLTMSVAEKVQLALKGDRSARSLLIRESSKLIQEAVIKSPKITENEIETFASMRSLSADVLRQMAQNREFTRNYSITHHLVKNPRCPQPQAIQLMANLQERDLKFLLKDKSVAEAIRRQSKILLAKRQQR